VGHARAGRGHVAAGRWSFGGSTNGDAVCSAGQGFAWDDDTGPQTAAPDAGDHGHSALIVVTIEATNGQ
jgi:hypothetical protein